MELACIFAAALLAAVLLSETERVSPFSIATMFLGLGFGLGWIVTPPGHQVSLLYYLTELALFTLLFTDGTRIHLRELASHWALPARALLLGLPLTLGLVASLAHFLVGLSWPEALLVGAALSPTDPVFASALIERKEVPTPLRKLLAIESGLNDGLCAPLVIILLAVLAGGPFEPAALVAEILGGTALGIFVPWLACKFHGLRIFHVANRHKPLYGFALAMLLLTSSNLLGVQPFLAAFAGGITLRAVSPDLREPFQDFGQLLGELLKLAGIFVFGLLLSEQLLGLTGWPELVFALLVLVVVRPLAFWACLLGTPLDRAQRLAAAWFGPRGFASVLFALWIYSSGVERATELCALVAVVAALSMLAHSGTDTLVVGWFARHADREATAR